MLLWFLSSLSSQIKNIFVVKTFMTISLMNISGTNRILPCRTTRGIIYKSKWYDSKSNRKNIFRFDMVPNTHTFWTTIISRIIFFCLYHFLNTVCLYSQGELSVHVVWRCSVTKPRKQACRPLFRVPCTRGCEARPWQVTHASLYTRDCLQAARK